MDISVGKGKSLANFWCGALKREATWALLLLKIVR